MAKYRLDELLVKLDLATDPKHAQKLILAGEVFVNEERTAKAGSLIDENATIRLLKKSQYVSRAGEKLKGAIDFFELDLSNIIAVDLGASTGGFTDCLLKEGAAKVYAVDVGKNELAWNLRKDERVVNLSGVNARSIDQIPSETFAEKPTFATIDLSFISSTLVLSSLKEILSRPANILLLVKPQFELPKDQISPGGVVNDPSLHAIACSSVSEFAINKGYNHKGTYTSPVRGLKKGNQEYFLYLTLV